MKKYLSLLFILLPTLIFAQNNSNTIFIEQINNVSFFDKNSNDNYDFNFIYKNTDNINSLIKNLKKSKSVESCNINNNKINIKFKTSNINTVSKVFMDNDINFIDLNNKIIPLEYIKIDNSTIPPPDNNVDMSNRDNVLYHEYVIYSIKYKLHYMQANLTKLSNAAKTGHLTNMYNQITKEKEAISELNQ